MTNPQADALSPRETVTTWTVGGRLHPSGSLIARALRRWTGDPLRAEALHLLIGSLFALACSGAYLISGSLSPDWSASVATWAIWASTAGAFVGLVGWTPGLHVLLSSETLLIRQGEKDARIALNDIVSCGALDARTFHRVHRRYADVRTFAVRTDALLLIETTDAPLVIGFATPSDRDALHEAMQTHPAPTCIRAQVAVVA